MRDDSVASTAIVIPATARERLHDAANDSAVGDGDFDQRPRGRSWRRLFAVVIAGVFVALALAVIYYRPYTPRSDFAYVLGVAGGSAMLVLFLYPLRKRLRSRRAPGRMRYWFQMHMVCGVLGPVLILFHSTFAVSSINAGVAVACMLMVATSGLVGRFLYRRIHHGLYGRRASLTEIENILAERLANLNARVEPLPEIKRLADDFAAGVVNRPAGLAARIRHFVALGWKRRRVVVAVRSARRQYVNNRVLSTAELDELIDTLGNTLRAMQRAAQFSTYEKLFSLWHVAHVPVVYLFVVTAVVHVIAVHIY